MDAVKQAKAEIRKIKNMQKKKPNAWFVRYNTNFDTHLGMRSRMVQKKFKTKKQAENWWKKAQLSGKGEKGYRELEEIYWSEY